MRRMTAAKLAKGHTLYVDDNPRGRSLALSLSLSLFLSLLRAPSRPRAFVSPPHIHRRGFPPSRAVAPFLSGPLPSAEQTAITLFRSHHPVRSGSFSNKSDTVSTAGVEGTRHVHP